MVFVDLIKSLKVVIHYSSKLVIFNARFYKLGKSEVFPDKIAS